MTSYFPSASVATFPRIFQVVFPSDFTLIATSAPATDGSIWPLSTSGEETVVAKAEGTSERVVCLVFVVVVVTEVWLVEVRVVVVMLPIVVVVVVVVFVVVVFCGITSVLEIGLDPSDKE